MLWLEGGEKVFLGWGLGLDKEWFVFVWLVLNGIVIYLRIVFVVWEFMLVLVLYWWGVVVDVIKL